MSEAGRPRDLWLASGVRTPFAKVDGPLAGFDAIALSVPVVRHMLSGAAPIRPDLAVWGTVAPNLTWSNIAREVMLDAKVDPTIPAYATVMACATSMVAALTAAGLIEGGHGKLAIAGGVESMSRIQFGLKQKLSDTLRRFFQAKSLGQKLAQVTDLKPGDVGLYIPSVTNRATGMSMGEHTEVMAKDWLIEREDQDRCALASHERAVKGWANGFFDDLVIPVGDLNKDTLPRADTSFEKLAKLPPSFDRTSGKGSLTAGNSSPITDGAAALWVASGEGLAKLPSATPHVRLVDWEFAAVDIWNEGLLMAPAYAVPRMLARNKLTYGDVALWEIHEAFSAQVLVHLKAFEDAKFLREKAGVTAALGPFPRDRLNPHGGSVALGHPFGATGARILSQAVKELAAMPTGSRAVVSICTDGGLGSVALLQAA